MRNLQKYGPWALITGASDGIGKALADQIAASRHTLPSLLATKAGFMPWPRIWRPGTGSRRRNWSPTSPTPTPSPLSNPPPPHGHRAGGAAAGFGTTGTFLETSLGEEMALIAVNITAVTRLAHTFAGRLAGRGKGGLVLFGSIVGWQGVPGQANYAASKAYVQSLAEGLHDELKPAGVDVLSVAPGPVGLRLRHQGRSGDDRGRLTRDCRHRHAQGAGPTSHRGSWRAREVPHHRVATTAAPPAQPHPRQGHRRNARRGFGYPKIKMRVMLTA